MDTGLPTQFISFVRVCICHARTGFAIDADSINAALTAVEAYCFQLCEERTGSDLGNASKPSARKIYVELDLLVQN